MPSARAPSSREEHTHEDRDRQEALPLPHRSGAVTGAGCRAGRGLAPGRVQVGVRRVLARHRQPHRARHPLRGHGRRAPLRRPGAGPRIVYN